MPYEFYKVLHFSSILLTFCSYASLLILKRNTANSSDTSEDKRALKAWTILHGVGTSFVLISGFGLAARLNLISVFPQWLRVKLFLWLLLGGLLTVVNRKIFPRSLVYTILAAIFLTAATLAVTKPF